MKKPITRRKFVSTTAATAFAFNFFPSRVFGANDRILLGGIGVGGKARADGGNRGHHAVSGSAARKC